MNAYQISTNAAFINRAGNLKVIFVDFPGDDVIAIIWIGGYRNSLDNLIITDYLEFRFYRDGLPVTNIKLANVAGNTIVAKPENFAAFTSLITDFAAYIGQTITSPSKLAKMMAGKAKLLAIVIEKALTSDEQSEADSSLKEQMQAFKSILIK
ncbi:MAG: hypothetical protein LUQ48_08275 [Methylococcaceae bacterium]|nr:hypothetical protein [Methylococcaceae bacterium]